MSKLILIIAICILGGCGTYVPSIQEIPGDGAVGQEFVHKILSNVTCEIHDAVKTVIDDDIK